MSETSVVILNWNGARLLPECLTALASQSYRDFELWLVDNGSIDESQGMLDDLERGKQPSWLGADLPHRTRIIRNELNLGFAEGNNQAMRLSRSRYVVLLNNDAIPEADWLGELVAAADGASRSVGMVASTMLFSHMPERVASAGISIHQDGVALDRGIGLRDIDIRKRGIMPVFGPSGGAALYKSALLQDVGLFDARYFSYLEDADLAWRARLRGWRGVHNPAARVRHEYSATGGHNSPFKTRLLARNRVWLLYKNMPSPLLQHFAPLVARYDSLAILNAIARRDLPALQGRFEGIRALPQLTASRRKILTSARLHPMEFRSLLAPALGPSMTLKYRARINSLLSTTP